MAHHWAQRYKGMLKCENYQYTVSQKIQTSLNILTIHAGYEAKITVAKICIFWTFRPVIKLINQWAYADNCAYAVDRRFNERIVYYLQTFAISTSYVASILKVTRHLQILQKSQKNRPSLGAPPWISPPSTASIRRFHATRFHPIRSGR